MSVCSDRTSHIHTRPAWWVFTWAHLCSFLGIYFRGGRKRKTIKLSRDLSNLVVFTNSVASQECLNEGEMPKLTHTQTRLFMSGSYFMPTLWVYFYFQVLQVMFCRSVRTERNLWSTTGPSSSWLLTRGSCHGFIPRPIASTHLILTLSFTGTWAVSWVRHITLSLKAPKKDLELPQFNHLSDITQHFLTFRVLFLAFTWAFKIWGGIWQHLIFEHLNI